MKSLRNQALLLALALIAVAFVTGCGGGGSSSAGPSSADGASSSSTSTEAAGATSSGAEGEPVAAALQTGDPVSEGSSEVAIEPRDVGLGVDNDEMQTTGAKPVKPCKLVTVSEAAAILGPGTKAAERPQGPTCVYSNAGRTVTLVVEDNSVKSLREGARKATKVEVGGKTGWCIKYQSTAVIVAIGGGRVLRADGPCQAGVRFVTKALTRI
jgi:hypothetical protein